MEPKDNWQFLHSRRSPCWLEEFRRKRSLCPVFDHPLGRECVSSDPVLSAVMGRKDAERFPEAKDELPPGNREGLEPSKARELGKQRRESQGCPRLQQSGAH